MGMGKNLNQPADSPASPAHPRNCQMPEETMPTGTKNRRRPSGLTIVRCLAALSVFLFLFRFLLFPLVSEFTNCPFNDLPFDPQEWTRATPRNRARMAADLVGRHIPKGTKREEVGKLLGVPGRSDQDRDMYWIGSWSFSPGGYDDTFVSIAYDENGCVVHSEVTGF